MLKRNAVGASHSSLHIWREQGTALKGQPTGGGRGRGLRRCSISQRQSVTAMVARARAVPNLPALWGAARGAHLPASARAGHEAGGPLPRATACAYDTQTGGNLEKSKDVGGERGPLGANFHQQPERRTGRRRSQQVQGMTASIRCWHWQLVNTWQRVCTLRTVS